MRLAGNSTHKIPFVHHMVFNIGFGIFFIPNLQFPRIVEIAAVFEINVYADIAARIAQIPVFQAVFCFPAVKFFQNSGDCFRRPNQPRAENIVQDVVDRILGAACQIAADFIMYAFCGFHAVEKVYAACVGKG